MTPQSNPTLDVMPHLLVVDDVEANRNVLRQQLERASYKVSTVGSGREALDLLGHSAVDLVLLDLHMPEMDGIEVLRAIREKHSRLSLPVIMVTAESRTERIIEALKSGANDYLVKPLHMQATLARIEAQLSLIRLAAIKDEMVSFASHDLKKPLLVMMDIAQTLKADLQNQKAIPEEAEELLQLMLQTGDNMQQVINGFVEQANRQQGDSESIRRYMDIHPVVQRCINANKDYAARKGIELAVEFADGLAPVKINEFRVCQVLDNLIGNAIKFSPRNTKTTVRTLGDEDRIIVEVVDNGPGLQEEDFEHLFEKNAKLSNQPTGNEQSSGMGLAICKQLIALDEGTIGARNNAFSGATFWIELPVQ